VRKFKAKLLVDVDAPADVKEKAARKLAIANHVEVLLVERFKVLKGPMIDSNLLRCCTSNMMTCGGDKAHEFTDNHDGTLTAHRSRNFLCPKSI
jgi:hypothetical protein